MFKQLRPRQHFARLSGVLQTWLGPEMSHLPLWHLQLIYEELVVWDALLLKCQHRPV